MPCPQCIETNLIEKCPADNSVQHFFTEICINHTLIIPEPKPDVEIITNVTKNFTIEDVEVLTLNFGGFRPLTNAKKVIIAGTLTLGIEYSALVPSQEVHFAHFDIPFRAIIGYRPCTFFNRGLITEDLNFDINDYNVRICVEHEQYHLINPREISKVLVLLIWLEPKNP